MVDGKDKVIGTMKVNRKSDNAQFSC